MCEVNYDTPIEYLLELFIHDVHCSILNTHNWCLKTGLERRIAYLFNGLLPKILDSSCYQSGRSLYALSSHV